MSAKAQLNLCGLITKSFLLPRTDKYTPNTNYHRGSYVQLAVDDWDFAPCGCFMWLSDNKNEVYTDFSTRVSDCVIRPDTNYHTQVICKKPSSVKVSDIVSSFNYQADLFARSSSFLFFIRLSFFNLLRSNQRGVAVCGASVEIGPNRCPTYEEVIDYSTLRHVRCCSDEDLGAAWEQRDSCSIYAATNDTGGTNSGIKSSADHGGCSGPLNFYDAMAYCKAEGCVLQMS